ncbi:putative exo-1,4-beta-xylosidase [Fulvia fulva]|uniref:xylan 1,4-beta-xylosidase n=1 Tax=Passalora fulva TaxID=5499 RepID=A0A9Q8PDV2_PASFU|nr:putative exo-1,4-beta-xylosidase [Fulvia fulva]KAK4619287.1 putative exo-1,4-beta-xylosidase [Fulvia fulva]UJO20602.1 putative exo-1,4-beta-xylosidase [Fulvia fulva]
MSIADIPPLAVNFSAILPTFLNASTTRTLPDCSIPPLSNVAIHDRASFLIAEFTLEEKINRTGFLLGEIPRLGLPSFSLYSPELCRRGSFWNEALHGVANILGAVFAPNSSEPYSSATSFPQPILMAAAFDDSLVHSVASIISTEARAFGNAGRTGLNFFTPNVNPFRDPRWGRGLETPGEDPFHVAEYTKALLKGLEAEEDGVKRVVATCKHLAA